MSQSKRRVTVVQRARAFVAFSRDNDSDKGVQNTEPVKVQGTPTLNPTLNPLAKTSSTTAPLKSSSVPPGNKVSQPNVSDVQKKLLAFRLITKMLQRIPQTQPFLSVDNLKENNNWNAEDRNEVRISDAFAHLAIADHGAVAIATNHQFTLEEPSNLGVIACATLPITSGSTKSTPNVSILSKMWNIMLAKNPRYNDPHHLSAVINTPEEPSDYSKFENLNHYMTNLEEDWKEPTLSSHLWILGKLLESRTDSTQAQLQHLYIYILSVCCRKMSMRLKSQSSKHYLQSLFQVKDFAFNLQPFGKTSTQKTSRDFLREKLEIDNDRRLLEDIIMNAGNLINVMLTGTDGTRIPTRNLLLTRDEEPFELYTNATCMEFHQLLVRLLKGYQETVDKLSKLSKSLSDPQTFDKIAFKQELTRGRGYGYALMRIARGRAFRMHMENIEHLLSDYNSNTEASDSVPEGEQEGEDEDDELESDKGSLSKSYGKWLRLMVVHFDAIEILVDFVNGVGKRFETISIKILVPPTTDFKLLPWSELFTHPNLLPEIDLMNPSSVTKSNAEIKEFLENAIVTARFNLEAHTHANTAQAQWNADCYTQTRNALIKLRDTIQVGTSASNSSLNTASEILGHVNNWIKIQKNNKIPRATKNFDEENKLKRLIDEGILNICDTYYKPPAIDKFYLSLEKEDVFTGTMHADAFLGSLLDNCTQNFDIDTNLVDIQVLEEMKGYGRVIGVSKRCCPACSNFLHFISPLQQPFLVRGAHSNVSPCTLPPWTPSHIVDKMVALFGDRLRKDLIALMPMDRDISTSFTGRRRTVSSGSQTLSINSNAGHNSQQIFNC